MAYLLSPYMMYEDTYQGLLGEPMDAYADAGQQVPQVVSAPVVQPTTDPYAGMTQDQMYQLWQDNPYMDWATGKDYRTPEQLAVSAIFDRLAAGEQIPGWTYNPATTYKSSGDSEQVFSEPATAQYGGQSFLQGGFQQQNESLGDVFKDVARLAAIMGTAYLGGQALAGGFGGGTAAGTAAGTGGSTLSSLGSVTQLAPTLAEAAPMLADVGGLSMGANSLTAGLPSLGTVGTAAGSLLSQAAPAVLSETAPQVITTTAAKAAPSLVAPAVAAGATGLAAGSLLSDPYANETAKFQRQQPGDLANTGSGPEVPTVNVDPSPLDQFTNWMKANPLAGRLLMAGGTALLSAAGGSGGGSSGGGYKDSGYRPTISRGGFNPRAQAKQMPTQSVGLLNRPTTGQANSGLWRYGLLG